MVHLCGENVSPDTWKIRKEDCNVTSTWPVTESFFQNDIFKATGSLWLPEEKKLSNELAKHLNHHQWIFGSYSYANSLNEINTEVSLKNYSANAVKTWLEHGTGTKYCQQAEATAALNILRYFKWYYMYLNRRMRSEDWTLSSPILPQSWRTRLIKVTEVLFWYLPCETLSIPV